MKETLTILEPELAKKSVAVAELMKNLANEQKQADKVRNIVKTDEESAKVIIIKVTIISIIFNFLLGSSDGN